jgi:regulation of enolase protein 1 (concanavalin A-like superfamily)
MILLRDKPAFPPGGFPTQRKGFANSTLCLLSILCAHSSALASSSVGLEWDSNPETDIAGYRVSYGTTPGNYPNSVRVGTTPAATVSGLDEGTTYYFVVAAINDAGLQGPYSDVVSFLPPVEDFPNELPDSEATLDITVTPSPTDPEASTPPLPPPDLPPVFTHNPLGIPDASEGVAYAGQTLAGSAIDPDPVTYWKVSGPAWLNVATDGTLSGTPPLGSSGLNGFIVRAIDSSSLAADAELRIHVGWLPIPWQSTHVGTGQPSGSVTHDTGIFTQTGAGVLGRNRDNFRFTYQMLSGDGEVTAKVSSLLGYGTWVHAGVMIRDSLAQNSRHVLLGLTNTTSYRVLSRTKAGAGATTKSSATFSGSDTWVRLVRSGSRIISYKSANGINWTYVATTKVNLNRDCYIGLVVASGSNGANFTARFSNVTVVP